MERSFSPNRRRGPDVWVKFIKFASITVWGLMLLILIFVDRAKPEVENFFTRLFKINLQPNWNSDLLSNAFYLSIVAFIFSLFAFLVNMKRHRRKTDKYSKSLITMLCFSSLIILLYFLVI